jgi:hypothetical protein
MAKLKKRANDYGRMDGPTLFIEKLRFQKILIPQQHYRRSDIVNYKEALLLKIFSIHAIKLYIYINFGHFPSKCHAEH